MPTPWARLARQQPGRRRRRRTTTSPTSTRTSSSWGTKPSASLDPTPGGRGATGQEPYRQGVVYYLHHRQRARRIAVERLGQGRRGAATDRRCRKAASLGLEGSHQSVSGLRSCRKSHWGKGGDRGDSWLPVILHPRARCAVLTRSAPGLARELAMGSEPRRVHRTSTSLRAVIVGSPHRSSPRGVPRSGRRPPSSRHRPRPAAEGKAERPEIDTPPRLR